MLGRDEILIVMNTGEPLNGRAEARLQATGYLLISIH